MYVKFLDTGITILSIFISENSGLSITNSLDFSCAKSESVIEQSGYEGVRKNTARKVLVLL